MFRARSTASILQSIAPKRCQQLLRRKTDPRVFGPPSPRSVQEGLRPFLGRPGRLGSPGRRGSAVVVVCDGRGENGCGRIGHVRRSLRSRLRRACLRAAAVQYL